MDERNKILDLRTSIPVKEADRKQKRRGHRLQGDEGYRENGAEGLTLFGRVAREDVMR